MDVKIVCGHRNERVQNSLYYQGYSKVMYPNSRHNSNPSRAVDLAPHPINWKDRDQFIFMAGLFMAIAHMLGIGVKWGGDWNQNNKTSDESFQDLGHFELLGSED
jgi:peptidoglycan L-alanyl-D-glutamate endopeptidase CwlK